MRADPAEPPARPRHGALQIAERYGLMAVLVIAFVAFSVLLPETFPTLGNVKAMINSQAIILLLALALTLPLRSGDFDLSIAGTMTAAAAVVAQLTTTGTSIPVAIGAALALGVVVGLLNGFLVVKVGINSFIVTLGMMTALGGLGYAITGSSIVPNLPAGVLRLARTMIFGLPSVVWFGWALVLVFWYVYERTPSGAICSSSAVAPGRRGSPVCRSTG